MSVVTPSTFRQIRSLLLPGGELRVSLDSVAMPPPADDEIIVRIDASPINPSDIGQLFGAADLATLRDAQFGGAPTLAGHVPPPAMEAMALRIGQPLPCGNEGAGVVVAAGREARAQALLGKLVAVLGGGMYAQYRCLKAAEVLELPAGTTAEQGASCFVNPLTALGFVETARALGHTALVQTAAASNLGLMLNRICLKDDLQLVNIVRSPDQVALLKQEGATHVLDSTQPDFLVALTDALAVTGATIAFDAVGGGRLAGDVLSCMESALNRTAGEFSRYGSSTIKRIYIYGGLDAGSIELRQSMGKAWSVNGWLLTNFLREVGPTRISELKARVASEVATTFASHYSDRLSLAQVLEAAHVVRYVRRSTRQKFLVCPQRA